MTGISRKTPIMFRNSRERKNSPTIWLLSNRTLCLKFLTFSETDKIIKIVIKGQIEVERNLRVEQMRVQFPGNPDVVTVVHRTSSQKNVRHYPVTDFSRWSTLNPAH